MLMLMLILLIRLLLSKIDELELKVERMCQPDEIV